MKRILAVLTVLCLVWTLPPAAAQAAGPALVCEEGAGGTSLTVEGLEEAVCAVQLELTLRGACPDAVFVSAVPGAYVPACRTEVRGDETLVTIYMAAPEGVLTNAGSLYLGTLSAGGDFFLPEQGEILLLNRDLKPCRGSGTVAVRGVPSSGGAGRVPPVVSDPGVPPSGGSRPDETVTLPQEPSAEPLPFLDIPEGWWSREAVAYVYRAGLMNGVSDTAFAPAAATTRGMIVAILHRMEGAPAAGVSAAFADVDAGAYYAAAVAWAAANGIVTGYDDGTFRPDDPITREQMAAFLFRYARYQGRDVSQRADLSGYVDADRIAGYALEALAWANARGLITGVSADTIAPAGNATREQAAVILTRFLQDGAQP